MTTRAAVSLWTSPKLARVYLMVYQEDFLFPFKIATSKGSYTRKGLLVCFLFSQNVNSLSLAPDSATSVFLSSL